MRGLFKALINIAGGLILASLEARYILAIGEQEFALTKKPKTNNLELFMRLHRFYVNPEIGTDSKVVIHDSELFHQLRNVFRFTIGGQVILLDNTGFEYLAMISDFGKGDATFQIISRTESVRIPNRELHLYASLIKKSNFEWVLEKGTELGVTKFIPIISDRSEKKSLNVERAEKILREASEQSGRAILPTLASVTTLEDALATDIPIFAFDPSGDVFTVEHTHNYSPLGILIGPEGGWSEKELFLFKKENVRIHTLGELVLRAETASVAVASLILLQ